MYLWSFRKHNTQVLFWLYCEEIFQKLFTISVFFQFKSIIVKVISRWVSTFWSNFSFCITISIQYFTQVVIKLAVSLRKMNYIIECTERLLITQFILCVRVNVILILISILVFVIFPSTMVLQINLMMYINHLYFLTIAINTKMERKHEEEMTPLIAFV